MSDWKKTPELPGFLIGGFDRVLERRCHLGAFDVVASAKREVGAPRSGGVVVVVHSATGGVADVTSDGASTTSGVVHLVIHTATGGVADIASAGAHPIGMNVGSSLPRNPRCGSIGGGGAGCDRAWWPERLAGAGGRGGGRGRSNAIRLLVM